MKVITCYLWWQHYVPLSIIALWNFNRFMKVHVLVTLCPKPTNMLLMMRRWLSVWNRSMWRLPKVTYKRQSHGQRSREREGNNGKGHVLRGGCSIGNWRPQWWQDLLVKWSCSKRYWNSKRLLFCVMGSRRQLFSVKGS